jgi:hypothetical protein
MDRLLTELVTLLVDCWDRLDSIGGQDDLTERIREALKDVPRDEQETHIQKGLWDEMGF